MKTHQTFTSVLAASLALAVLAPATGSCDTKNHDTILNALKSLAASVPKPGAVLTETFELPKSRNYTVVRAGQSFTTATNTWKVLAASVDIVNTTVQTGIASFDGVQSIDLAGSPGPGSIATTFATKPGQAYMLTFHYGRNNLIGRNVARARAEVLGATPLLQGDVEHNPAVLAFNSIQTFNGAFVADGTSATLRFTSLTGGNYGIALDAVTIAPTDATVTPTSVTPTSVTPSAPPAPSAPVIANLSGEYVYLGRGIATVTQVNDQVRILATWTPVAGGPHYEMKGKLVGDTIVGEWYSHYKNQGWFRLIGRVHPDGSIDLAGSDDPIRANIKTTVLTRKR